MFLSNKVIIYQLGKLLAFNDEFNDFENATKMFEKVLKLDHTNKEACEDISDILFDLDHQFTLKRSQELFAKIIKVLNNRARYYNDFGELLMNKYHALAHARAMFDKARNIRSLNDHDETRNSALSIKA